MSEIKTSASGTGSIAGAVAGGAVAAAAAPAVLAAGIAAGIASQVCPLGATNTPPSGAAGKSGGGKK